MSEYSDVQKAVNVEKFRIWFAWACGGFVGLGVAIATQHVHIVSVITQVLFVGLGVLFTIAAVRMTNALDRKADAARKKVLGDM
ncbi:hypothetical protein [Streptomyces antibioticus]|uniref:hypothetical protein n=1 Tax=Streptomyces antibioticus TaxID=1890 RepID=UPI0004CA2F05|nr:hypothetical protein [Streptomyces antibioticus]MCX5167626.1 hypothetical protein [Streptomyces antibioticus]